jgi:CBS domain-containing protein
MELQDVIEKAFLVKPDETLSYVISRMSGERRYEAFVFDGEFKGIVTLDDIVKRRVTDPQKIKISYFMKPLHPFSVSTSVEDIINYMLVSEYRSVPIEKEGEIYAVTKPKLLKFVKDEVFETKKAEDVMQFPYCASENDTVSTVISIMKDTGMNRIPILNGEGRFMGLIDSLSLFKVFEDQRRSKRGERFGDRMKLEGIGVKAFMRTDVLKAGPETNLKNIVKDISKEGVCAVIVEKNEKFMGIITVKDIFKLIGKSLETVYIRITGLDDEDEFIKAKIDDMVENTISKLLKFTTVTYVAIHVDTMKTGGSRTKYSVHGRIVTEKGSFHASESKWDPTKAIKLFLSKIEREVHKHVEKSRGY